MRSEKRERLGGVVRDVADITGEKGEFTKTGLSNSRPGREISEKVARNT